jgi:hypothetical protein
MCERMLTLPPVLLEKTIYAFALLDALAARGLDFIFKGGTSLLLRLPRIRRLSIDADILCNLPAAELDTLLLEISHTSPFTRMIEDDRGPHRLPARRHFKFFYTPLDTKNPAPFVLLDVVKEINPYPKVEAVPLRTTFVEGDGTLMVPTVEDLLGDKLTAFGPNTTGIPLNERFTMQFMKHVFDIGELFNAATDLTEVGAAYAAIFNAENGYRGGLFSMEQALHDAFDTAYCIAQVGLAGAPTDSRCELIESGRRQLESHLVGARFRREDMKTAAAKAAFLTCSLHSGIDLTTMRYDETKLNFLKTFEFPVDLPALRRLKAIPEAMWYWSLAARLRTGEVL